MSHFTVGVITRDPHNVDYLLRPYDENGTDYYIKELYMSKEDYINSYKNEHPDTTLTDEQIYATANDMYTGVEEDGIYDYYNPDAKWDWYEIGGRWPNSLTIISSSILVTFKRLFVIFFIHSILSSPIIFYCIFLSPFWIFNILMFLKPFINILWSHSSFFFRCFISFIIIFLFVINVFLFIFFHSTS